MANSAQGSPITNDRMKKALTTLNRAIFMRESQQAATAFQQLLDEDPDFMLAPKQHFEMARLLELGNEAKLALGAYEQILSNHEGDEKFMPSAKAAGHLSYRLRQYKKCRSYLERFLNEGQPTPAEEQDAEGILNRLPDGLGVRGNVQLEEQQPDSGPIAFDGGGGGGGERPPAVSNDMVNLKDARKTSVDLGSDILGFVPSAHGRASSDRQDVGSDFLRGDSAPKEPESIKFDDLMGGQKKEDDISTERLSVDELERDFQGGGFGRGSAPDEGVPKLDSAPNLFGEEEPREPARPPSGDGIFDRSPSQAGASPSHLDFEEGPSRETSFVGANFQTNPLDQQDTAMGSPPSPEPPYRRDIDTGAPTPHPVPKGPGSSSFEESEFRKMEFNLVLPQGVKMNIDKLAAVLMKLENLSEGEAKNAIIDRKGLLREGLTYTEAAEMLPFIRNSKFTMRAIRPNMIDKPPVEVTRADVLEPGLRLKAVDGVQKVRWEQLRLIAAGRLNRQPTLDFYCGDTLDIYRMRYPMFDFDMVADPPGSDENESCRSFLESVVRKGGDVKLTRMAEKFLKGEAYRPQKFTSEEEFRRYNKVLVLWHFGTGVDIDSFYEHSQSGYSAAAGR